MGDIFFKLWKTAFWNAFSRCIHCSNATYDWDEFFFFQFLGACTINWLWILHFWIFVMLLIWVAYMLAKCSIQMIWNIFVYATSYATNSFFICCFADCPIEILRTWNKALYWYIDPTKQIQPKPKICPQNPFCLVAPTNASCSAIARHSPSCGITGRIL